MSTVLPTALFSCAGHYLMLALLVCSCLLGASGFMNLLSRRPAWQRPTGLLLMAVNVLFAAGFAGMCWFHYQIYSTLTLEVPAPLAGWINGRLAALNQQSAYSLPLYDAAHPPRYAVPLWIENGKHYFWFMCYSFMALAAHCRIANHRFRAVVHLFLTGQVALLFFAADPFSRPLPLFFQEVSPWFGSGLSALEQAGLFMRLYARMHYYYNAPYMWFHPPMLFLSYACITLTFITSLFMLVLREPALEAAGYDFAKLGYFLLTLGMLLGYPWALQAWEPNWWWDPKICSSIMMWAVYSTYLHTRLHAHRAGMWYFTAALGIVCFLSMVVTFVTSFYFPGQHTSQ